MAGAHRAPAQPRGLWVPLREHLAETQMLRDLINVERDRRYAEVGIEREKALKIKEVADRDALALARADQTYKDERANNLRTQIEQERGNYATKEDLRQTSARIEEMIKPALALATAVPARSQGSNSTTAMFMTLGALGIAAASVLIALFK